MKLSLNTLLVHLPQHLIFALAIIVGDMSWLLVSYLSWMILGYFGFSVWYHRYFAHQAFKTYRVWEIVWGYLGMLVGRGSPLNLASVHCALHHPHADTERDPHTPLKGKFFSWASWTETHEFKIAPRAVRHLVRDRYIKFLDKHYLMIFWGTFAILMLVDWRVACFGMMGAGVIHFHVEGAVSTLCHLESVGSQDFKMDNHSRNLRGAFNWLTLGTGLHNSHHANPGSYHYALLPGDFDLAKYIVPLFIKR